MSSEFAFGCGDRLLRIMSLLAYMCPKRAQLACFIRTIHFRIRLASDDAKN